MNINHADQWRVAAPLLAGGAAVPSRSAAAPLLDALAFTIPSLLFVEFNMSSLLFVEFSGFGRLFLPEVLLVGLIPLLAARKAAGRVDFPRWVIILGILWLFGQVLTDAVHGSAFVDYSRGWSKIAFTITNASALFLLLNDNPRRLLLFGLGLAAGSALQYYLNPGVLAPGDPWKFGLGWPITLFSVLLVSHGPLFRVRLVAPFVLVFLALLNLENGFRMLAGVCFLAGAYLLLQLLPHSRSLWRPLLSFRRLLLVCTFGLAGSVMFIQVYSYSAQAGLLGLDAQRKYEQQASGVWGLIVGGRTETLVSTQAILDSPIIGHGSWAKDFYYTDLLAERLARYGYTLRAASVAQESGLIPTHSYLLGAWVEAGMLGGLFWLAVLLMPAAVLANLYTTRLPLSPLFAFAAFSLTWDILFSPYGAVARLIAPYYVVVLLLAWQQMRDSSLIDSAQITAADSQVPALPLPNPHQEARNDLCYRP